MLTEKKPQREMQVEFPQWYFREIHNFLCRFYPPIDIFTKFC